MQVSRAKIDAQELKDKTARKVRRYIALKIDKALGLKKTRYFDALLGNDKATEELRIKNGEENLSKRRCNFLFRFKPGVLDVLKEQLESGITTKPKLAKAIGVSYLTVANALNDCAMETTTAAKFIKYLQKYHGWEKDEWREKVFEVQLHRSRN